jgi:hypothetical protein
MIVKYALQIVSDYRREGKRIDLTDSGGKDSPTIPPPFYKTKKMIRPAVFTAGFLFLSRLRRQGAQHFYLMEIKKKKYDF